MKFDWDENKAAENIQNHEDITFEEATAVFGDKWAIETFDESHSDSKEQRFTIVGLAANRLLRVTFAVGFDKNSNEIIRIISARKAKGYEKRDMNDTETNSTSFEVEITEKDIAELRESGVAENELPKIGVQKWQRTTRFAPRNKHEIKISIYLNGEILGFLRNRSDESPEKQINDELFKIMTAEKLQKEKLRQELLNDQKFISELSEKLKAA